MLRDSSLGRRKWRECECDGDDAEPAASREGRGLVGPKPPEPRPFGGWAATWRRDTRGFYSGHTEGHTDHVRRNKCAREMRDLTLADTAALVTVRMSLTCADIEIFSTSPRKT
jgi:hypothetical protein